MLLRSLVLMLCSKLVGVVYMNVDMMGSKFMILAGGTYTCIVYVCTVQVYAV